MGSLADNADILAEKISPPRAPFRRRQCRHRTLAARHLKARRTTASWFHYRSERLRRAGWSSYRRLRPLLIPTKYSSSHAGRGHLGFHWPRERRPPAPCSHRSLLPCAISAATGVRHWFLGAKTIISFRTPKASCRGIADDHICGALLSLHAIRFPKMGRADGRYMPAYRSAT